MPFLAAYISDPEHPREVSRAIFDDSGRVVGYTEVIQDGHGADQYPKVGLSSGNQALTRCAFVGTNSLLKKTGIPVF